MFIRPFICLLLTTFICSRGYAQYSEERVKANVLCRIVDYITWPPYDKDEAFSIVVVGNRPELVDELIKIAQKNKIHKRPIRVSVQNNPYLNNSAQVIFVDKPYYKQIDSILIYCQNNQILMVTDQLDAPLNSVINFTTSDRKNVRFEVNKQNLIISQLDYSDDLLLYGGSEVDIKDLFFKTQKHLDSISNQLRQESIKIQNLERLVSSKNETLKSQDSTITTFSDSIVSTRRKLKKQSQDINEKTNTIDRLTGQIITQNERVCND